MITSDQLLNSIRYLDPQQTSACDAQLRQLAEQFDRRAAELAAIPSLQRQITGPVCVDCAELSHELEVSCRRNRSLRLALVSAMVIYIGASALQFWMVR